MHHAKVDNCGESFPCWKVFWNKKGCWSFNIISNGLHDHPIWHLAIISFGDIWKTKCTARHHKISMTWCRGYRTRQIFCEKTQNLFEELSWIWDEERTWVNLEMVSTLNKFNDKSNRVFNKLMKFKLSVFFNFPIVRT